MVEIVRSPGTFIHLVAPFTLLPKPGTNTSNSTKTDTAYTSQ